MSLWQKEHRSWYSEPMKGALPESSGGAFFWFLVLILLLFVSGGFFFLESGYFDEVFNPPISQSQVKRYKVEVPAQAPEEIALPHPPDIPVTDAQKPLDEKILNIEPTVSAGDHGLRVKPDSGPFGTDDIANGAEAVTAPPPNEPVDKSLDALGPVQEPLPISKQPLGGTPPEKKIQVPGPPANAAHSKKEAGSRQDKTGTAAIEASKPDLKTVPEPVSHEKKTVSVPVGIVRLKPSTDAGAAFRVKKGETVSILETQEQWYRIQDRRNRSGWANWKLFSPDETQEPTPEVPVKSDLGRITGIEITVGSMGGDIVSFNFDKDRSPKTMVIEGNFPRVVCDFPEMSIDRSIVSKASGKGEVVARIRTGIHGAPEPKVRIVLDLKPSAHYTVRQIYDRANKRYILHILPQNDASPAS